jgi:hypothetical protein
MQAVGDGDALGVQVKVQVEVHVEVNVRARSGEGVEVTTVGVTGSNVGDRVGTRVSVGTTPAAKLPSLSESEKAPKIKPMETRAMTIPRSTCRKSFIVISLQTALPQPASEH